MSVDLGVGVDMAPDQQSSIEPGTGSGTGTGPGGSIQRGDGVERSASVGQTGDVAALEQMLSDRRPPRRSPAERLDLVASRLCAVLQPALSIPAGFALIGLLLGSSDRLRWALLVPALMGLVPTAALLLLRLTGRIRSLRVTGRPRVLLLAIGTGYEVAALAVLARLGAPGTLCSALGGGLLALVVLVVLQLATEVSVHTAALALVAGTLLPVAPVPAVAVALLAVLAGWSRVRVGAHTRVQAWLLPPLVGAVAALAVLSAG